ncbi:MAG TPA: MFS transporter [Thermomicrobiales bacterium]|nr:MFS transporter [Thermomicrobiales bacterium]
MERALTWARTPAGRGAVLLTVATLATGWAMAAQQNIVTNYFEDVLGLAGPQFGYITAIREVPGFLLIFLTALFYRLSLPKLTALALVVLAVGYGFYGHSHSFWTVVPWVIISSMGYHTWLQTQYALGMSLTTENRSGRILGRMSAVNNVGALLAMAVILLTFHFGWLSYRSAFVVCGAMALVAAVVIFGFPNLHNGELQARVARREPIVWRRDYRYYYGLSLLDGARMQIFFSFGLWVLVAHFGLPVPTISAVLLISTSASIWVGPWVGRNIDLYGERRMLSVVNILYIVALVGYALVNNVVAAVVCYLIYTLIMPLSSLGAATYLRKVAPADDIAPSLAMGVTMQHAAAIIVPVSTGFILNFVGYQVPFLIASCFACGAIVVTQRLAPERQKSARRIAEEARVAAGLEEPGGVVLAGRDERTQATWVEEPASGND